MKFKGVNGVKSDSYFVKWILIYGDFARKISLWMKKAAGD